MCCVLVKPALVILKSNFLHIVLQRFPVTLSLDIYDSSRGKVHVNSKTHILKHNVQEWLSGEQFNISKFLKLFSTMRFFHLCLCQPLPLPICDNLCL